MMEWMELSFEMLHSLCIAILLAAGKSLPLILIAIAVTWLLRRLLTARHLVCIWGLVVLRLLMPFSYSSAFSLQSPIAYWLTTASNDDAFVQTELLPKPLVENSLQSWIPANSAPHAVAQTVTEYSALDESLEIIVGLASLIAACVACVLLMRAVIAHWLFARRLSRSANCADSEVLQCLNEQCSALNLRTVPRLKVIPGLRSPAVFGLLRPTICLPENLLASTSAQERVWILRHELAHIIHRDAWWSTIASVVNSLHWFNPIAWFVSNRLRSSIELSADEVALAGCDTQAVVGYGRLLLRFAEQDNTPRFHAKALALVPLSHARNLQHRILKLTEVHTQIPWWSSHLFALLFLALAICGMTDAASPRQVIQPLINMPDDVSQLNEATVGYMGSDTHAGSNEAAEKTSTRVYDLEPCLKRLETQSGSAHTAEQEFDAAIKMFVPESNVHRDGSRLVADLTENQHKCVSHFIEAWALSGNRQVTIEMRVIQTRVDMVSSKIWSTNRIKEFDHQGAQPFAAAVIDEDMLRSLVVAVQSDTRTNILFAPRVTMFNGQRGTIASKTTRPFVTGVQPDEAGNLKPHVQLFDDGMEVDISAVIQDDESLSLTTRLELKNIGKIEMANLPLPDERYAKPNVTVQVPSVNASLSQPLCDCVQGNRFDCSPRSLR